VLAALPVFAQSPAGQGMSTAPSPADSALAPDQQATKEQIAKLFEVMRLRKQMQQMLSMMPSVVQRSFQEQMQNVSAKMPPGKQMTPQDQAALEKVMTKYMQQAVDMFPIDELVAAAIPVYQRHVSRDDADAIIAFYSSPPGQRLLDEQPAISSEYMAVVMSHMQEFSKRLTDQMTTDIENAVKPALPAPGAPAAPSN
jgi:hypothetical protein